VGNTDNLPIGRELAERYLTNWVLAAAHPVIVVRYLQEQGVDPTRLRAISPGHTTRSIPTTPPTGARATAAPRSCCVALNARQGSF